MVITVLLTSAGSSIVIVITIVGKMPKLIELGYGMDLSSAVVIASFN